jgi:hypothetical protein
MSALASDTLAGLLKLNDLNNADINVTDLLQAAPVINAMAAVPASQGGTQHLYMKETGATGAAFRDVNEGILNAASQDEQVTVSLKYFDGSFTRDVALADAYKGGRAAYMEKEVMRSIRNMFAGLEKNLLQGTGGVTGTGFTGFPDNTLVDGLSDTMVVNATGNGGQSVWFVKTAEDAVAMIAGNDGRIDFNYDPEKLTYIQTVASATPANQRGYMALAASLSGYFGVQYGNIYGLGRICNLDGADNKTLTDGMIADMLAKFPVSSFPNVCIMSRSALAQLQKSRTAVNATGAEAPFPTEVFGVPIIVSDHVKLDETAIS